MKKLLFVINNLGVGGAERQIVDDALAFSKKGYQVTFLTLRNEFEKSIIQEIQGAEIQIKKIVFKNIFDISAHRTFIHWLQQEQFAVIISHLWFANTIVRLAGIVVRKQKIMCFEQNVYDNLKTWKMFLIDRILQYYCYKIFAVSSTVKDSLIRHGIQSQRIEVLHNSVDLDKYQKAEKMIISNVPADAFKFLFVGRLIYQKAVDILLQAFAQVPKGVLLIAGQGSDRESLEQLAQKLGVADRVFFLGVISNIPNLMKSCDVFILPSRYEGLALVAVEAMATPLPIIISDFPATADIITHEQEGIIVPRENISELTNACIKLLNDAELRNYLKNNAFEKVKHFSLDRHTTILESYF